MQSASSLSLASLGQVSLHVRDLARAEQFYGETLGLPHVFTFGDLAFFDLDGTRLYLHRKDEDKWQPGSIVYFLVDDIATAYAELGGRGVELTDEPHRIFVHEDTGLEEWMAFFSDREGNTLALMEQRAPAAHEFERSDPARLAAIPGHERGREAMRAEVPGVADRAVAARQEALGRGCQFDLEGLVAVGDDRNDALRLRGGDRDAALPRQGSSSSRDVLRWPFRR